MSSLAFLVTATETRHDRHVITRFPCQGHWDLRPNGTTQPVVWETGDEGIRTGKNVGWPPDSQQLQLWRHPGKPAVAQCLCWSSRCLVSCWSSRCPVSVLVKPLPSVRAGQAAAQCPCWSSRCPVSVLVKRVPRLRWWIWHQVWHRHSPTPQFQNGVFGSCQLWNQTEKMTAMIKSPPLVRPSRTQLSPISHVNPPPPPAVTHLPRQPPRCHPYPTSNPPLSPSTPPLSPISHVKPPAVTHLPRQTPSCHPPPTSHPQLSPISHVKPPAIAHLPRQTPVTHLPRHTPSCHPSPTSQPQLSPISHVKLPTVTNVPRQTASRCRGGPGRHCSVPSRRLAG